MKRTVSLLLVFAMLFTLFALTGCQVTDSDKESGNTQDDIDAAHLHHAYVFKHLPNGQRLYYSCSERSMQAYHAIYQETGCNPLISFEDFYYGENENGNNAYKTYTNVVVYENYRVGCVYLSLTIEDYEALQEYQNRTGRQVIYPIVEISDRPNWDIGVRDANLYYKVEYTSTQVYNPVFDENGNHIPNYWKYRADDELPHGAVEYNSLRIEGEDGFVDTDGNSYFYIYGRLVNGGVEIRVFAWEMQQYLESPGLNLTWNYSVEQYFKC